MIFLTLGKNFIFAVFIRHHFIKSCFIVAKRASGGAEEDPIILRSRYILIKIGTTEQTNYF